MPVRAYVFDMFSMTPRFLPPRFLGLVVSMLMALGASSAHAVTCTPPDYAGVKVRLLDPQAKLMTSKNLKQINSKAQAHGLLKHGSLVLGLTQSQVETSMNMRFSGYTQGGVTCLNLARVDVRFGHSGLTVQLPSEYARGTCQYNTVLKHEMEHVRVNREGVRKYALILKRELDRAVVRLNPMQVKSLEKGQMKMKRAMEKVLASVTARFTKEINAKHAIIDKPGGPYDASGACRKW